MVSRECAGDVPAGERLDQWRSVLSDTFVALEPEPLSPHGEPADGAVRAATLGDVLVAEVEGSGQTVRRPPKLIHQQNPALLKVGLLVQGTGVVSQDGRHAELGVGDFAVYDTRRPYLVTFPEPFRMLVLMCPQPIIKLTQAQLMAVTATRISGSDGIAALISQFLRSLSERVHDTRRSLTDVVGQHLSEAVLELLTASLVDAVTNPASSAPGLRLQEIQAHIEANLERSSLTPESIAAAHHISVRHLQKMFGSQGSTVSGWVRSRRLERCRRDLHDDRLADHQISSIAARWGIADPAHFSRLFRSAYGLTPTEYRRSVAMVAARSAEADGPMR